MKDQTKYILLAIFIIVIFFMLYNNDTNHEGFTTSTNGFPGYGMWCTNQNCLNNDFMPQGLNRIYIGDFANDADGIPKKKGGETIYMDEDDLKNIKGSTGGSPIIFITSSGENAKKAAAADLIKLYQGGFEFDGLDFDMEGELGVKGDPTAAAGLLENCMQVVQTVSAAIKKPLYVQFTVLAGASPEGVTTWGSPYADIVRKYSGSSSVKQFNLALMLYGGSMTSDGWGCTSHKTGPTFNFIDLWLTKPELAPYKNQIILAMTPLGMEGDKGKCFMQSFIDYVNDNNLSGINFWQSSGMPCTVCQLMTDEKTYPGVKDILATPKGLFKSLICKKNSCPPPPAAGSSRCGANWADANGRCGTKCPSNTDTECTNGEHCFASLDMTPCNKTATDIQMLNTNMNSPHIQHIHKHYHDASDLISPQNNTMIIDGLLDELGNKLKQQFKYDNAIYKNSAKSNMNNNLVGAPISMN